MRAAHGSAILLLLLVGALGWTLIATGEPQGREDPTHPDQGELAPLGAEGPEPVALCRLGVGAGEVVDVAGASGGVAILTRNHWFIQTDDGLRGGFGDPTTGSPDWLKRPVSIAVGQGLVYVLDAGRFTLSVWSTDGVRMEDIPLRTGEDLSLQPTQVLLGPDGEPVVVSLAVGRDGTARWEATSYGMDRGSRVLFSRAGTSPTFIFERPFLAAFGGGLVGIQALTHAIFRYRPGQDGVRPLLRRAAPPLWYVPRRHRRSYDRRLAGMNGPAPALSQLPPFWPSVRDFSVTPDGRFLLAVTAGEDRQHLELLGVDGSPLRRLNLDGFTDPVFVDDGRAFLVEENLNETVIHELFIEPQ